MQRDLEDGVRIVAIFESTLQGYQARIDGSDGRHRLPGMSPIMIAVCLGLSGYFDPYVLLLYLIHTCEHYQPIHGCPTRLCYEVCIKSHSRPEREQVRAIHTEKWRSARRCDFGSYTTVHQRPWCLDTQTGHVGPRQQDANAVRLWEEQDVPAAIELLRSEILNEVVVRTLMYTRRALPQRLQKIGRCKATHPTSSPSCGIGFVLACSLSQQIAGTHESVGG